jgi:hypothetical protein
MTNKIFFMLFLMAACSPSKTIEPIEIPPQTETPETPTEADIYPAAQWTASYATGNFAFDAQYQAIRSDRKVGVFYFLWIGAHGYDRHEDHNEVQAPASTDVDSPYDNNEILKANPTNPQYGPVHAFHHWGKPYFNYYVSNDRWVIRKHAQMLSDAGVDVIFLDVTNALHYLPTVNILCEEYKSMRANGNKTPQIAFVLNAQPAQTLNTIYTQFYAAGLYKDLWFNWDDKPLILCPDDASIPASQKSFFTMRHTWFDSRGAWFGDGMNKWTWGDYYPQGTGKSAKYAKEEVSVLPATHPTSNLGRSFNGQTQPSEPEAESTGAGIYFKLQAQKALEISPRIVFLTGWNEWVAMRFTDGAAASFVGKPIKQGDTYFVDAYNHEYSRDMEPVDGSFGDNYYYYMADFIRKYKGVKPVEADKETKTITIDGAFDDWNAVKSIYTDDKGDITARNHYGYGRTGALVNQTGRNDIVETRVATDATSIYFFVATASDVTTYADPRWMRLFINLNGSTTPKWEDFGFVVNNTINSATSTVLERSKGNWQWEKVTDLSYRVTGNRMELAIPLSALGVTQATGFSIDFKWIDNAVESGDIKDCMRDGDSAPNSRFRYRYAK